MSTSYEKSVLEAHLRASGWEGYGVIVDSAVLRSNPFDLHFLYLSLTGDDELTVFPLAPELLSVEARREAVGVDFQRCISDLLALYAISQDRQVGLSLRGALVGGFLSQVASSQVDVSKRIHVFASIVDEDRFVMRSIACNDELVYSPSAVLLSRDFSAKQYEERKG